MHHRALDPFSNKNEKKPKTKYFKNKSPKKFNSELKIRNTIVNPKESLTTDTDISLFYNCVHKCIRGMRARESKKNENSPVWKWSNEMQPHSYTGLHEYA